MSTKPTANPIPAERAAVVTLQLRSNPLFLSGARELVYHVASRLGFSDESCGQLALAVDEAICNVIRHGYDKRADEPIWISLFADGGVAPPGHHGESPTDALRIVIEDEAKQVDLSTIKSRNLEEIRPGGLGVHIIQEVMDEVRYEHRPGSAGMRLTMIKRRSKPERTAPDGKAPDGKGQDGAGPGGGGAGGAGGGGGGVGGRSAGRGEVADQDSGRNGARGGGKGRGRGPQS